MGSVVKDKELYADCALDLAVKSTEEHNIYFAGQKKRHAKANRPPAPDGHPHYWIYVEGTLWVCKVCGEWESFPVELQDAFKFSSDIGRFGWKKAMEKRLKDKPKLKRQLELLNSGLEANSGSDSPESNSSRD